MAGGHNAKPFGEMVPSHEINGATYEVKSSKKSNTVKVAFTVDAATKWGVNGGGHTDVTSADDGVVTIDTYEAIVKDLTPRTGAYGGKDFGRSWVALRTSYWSRAICERHEKFHCTDERDWLKGQGKKFLTNYLNGKQVALTDDERKDKAKIAAKMAPILSDARKALSGASNTYYMGAGNSYYNYPGEVRAFGDGKASYAKLAKAVNARGKALVATAVGKTGWRW